MKQNEEFGNHIAIVDGRNVYAGDLLFCGTQKVVASIVGGAFVVIDYVSRKKLDFPLAVPLSWSATDACLAAIKSSLQTYAERAMTYGPSWLRHGAVMAALFPVGVTLKTAEEFNRYAKVDNVAMKLARYCGSFDNGGHKDSAHDIIVYAAMLEALTNE